MPKALIVLTSHDQLGNTGTKTGWYLPEVAHPYHVFKAAGYTCDFVSPKGGKAPMDPGSAEAFKEDKDCNDFLADSTAKDKLNNTKTPAQVDASLYDVVFYAGGHGPMFDLPENLEIAAIAEKVYNRGKVLGAVCHGTVGLCPVKIKGDSVVKGKEITCFTNDEEDAVQLSSVMPFMLETKLRELGATFRAGEKWQSNVCVSDRIVTGQNPASATATAEEIVKLLRC